MVLPGWAALWGASAEKTQKTPLTAGFYRIDLKLFIQCFGSSYDFKDFVCNGGLPGLVIGKF